MQIGVGYCTINAHITLTLVGFFGQNVTFESFLESDFTRTGNFKALFCATVGFNLWHCITFFSYSLLALRTDGDLWSHVGNVENSISGRKVNEKIQKNGVNQ